MKQIKNTFRFLTFAALMVLPVVIWSQQTSTYNLDPVGAFQLSSEKQNHILAILKVTPTFKDFKMIMSMRVTYEIGQGAKVINIQKQKEDNIRITIYGKDLAQKNQKLYDLIKDRVDLKTEEDVRLMVFDFYNITNQQIDKMNLIYGLWEGKNEDVRNEKEFTFKVENIN